MILRKVDLGALIGTDIAELAMRIVAALLILVVGLCPDLERGVAPFCPPVPVQPLLLGRGVAPLGRRP